jgi:Phospholipase_D-nuclease N-terminal
MLVASSYPFLNIFWTMMVFFFWVMYVFVVIWALIDNFRRSDHSGGAKALWTLFIIVLPAIGVLSYLIVRPSTAEDGIIG